MGCITLILLTCHSVAAGLWNVASLLLGPKDFATFNFLTCLLLAADGLWNVANLFARLGFAPLLPFLLADLSPLYFGTCQFVADGLWNVANLLCPWCCADFQAQVAIVHLLSCAFVHLFI